MIKTATFSPCRKYRYLLTRQWHDTLFKTPPIQPRMAMFIGLNPSTADETNDDPTVRRCIKFAQDWGYDGLYMTNIFAYRATDPRDMFAQEYPDDPNGMNDNMLSIMANCSSVVVAAWGVHGVHRNRDKQVCELLKNKLHTLRLTKDGHPAHPLYLPGNLTPMEWK